MQCENNVFLMLTPKPNQHNLMMLTNPREIGITMSLDKILPALIKLQSSAPMILKSADNPFYKSKYADLPAVWHAIKDLMRDNGLFVTHASTVINESDYLVTKIYHTSGQFIESSTPVKPDKAGPQAYGSAITYMRRYALMALLGLVTDDDDDGNGATNNAPKTNAAPAKTIAKPEVKTAEKTPQQIKIAGWMAELSRFTEITDVKFFLNRIGPDMKDLSDAQMKWVNDQIVAKQIEISPLGA